MASLPRQFVGRVARSGLRRMGYRLEKAWSEHPIPADFDDDVRALVARVRPYTLTTPERIWALRDAVRHVVARDLPGDVVECGVWRGGSVLVMLLTLLEMGVTDRDVWLYDTFTEMPRPGPNDVMLSGRPWSEVFEGDIDPNDPVYGYLPLDQVKALLGDTGYPTERLHFIQGLVEETIPDHVPEQISLCRLDTDWYESTRHEMEHLFPRIVPGGILVLDDYGEFPGARKAVDEALAADGRPSLLHRVDVGCRVMEVPASRSA